MGFLIVLSLMIYLGHKIKRLYANYPPHKLIYAK